MIALAAGVGWPPSEIDNLDVLELEWWFARLRPYLELKASKQ